MRLRTNLLLAFALLWLAAQGAAEAAASRVLNAADAKHARAAFHDVERGRWASARSHARRASETILAKLIEWHYLADDHSGASFKEIVRFIRDNPTWPGLAGLRVNAERVMPPELPTRNVLEWFKDNPPTTGGGMQRHGEALLAGGDLVGGQTAIRRAWVEGDLDSRYEKAFLARHAGQLTVEDHIARLDRLIWDEQATAARRHMSRVDAGHRLLALARLDLMEMNPGVEAKLARVPVNLRDDPGLAYERVRWRRRSDMDDAARSLLAKPPARLVRPDKWWTEQSILARRALEDGLISQAYELAGRYQALEGSDLAEASWLAGWIALRFLREPSSALRHFTAMAEAVTMPISVARAGYWSGRAAEAQKDIETARRWYQGAGKHAHTFYGQLALAALGHKAIALDDDPEPTEETTQAFARQDLVRAARIAGEIGDFELMRRFVLHLIDRADNPEAYVLAAQIARDFDQNHVAIQATKRGQRSGVNLIAAGYPTPDAFKKDSIGGRVALPLLLAVSRQESEMNPRAVSPAGAVGLMQLMPATARQTARGLGLRFEEPRLLRDPGYNLTLGEAYLGKLLGSFRGSYVLALAAYNAGPSRVSGWIEQFGDPRMAAVDTIDWIESIPFNETRNYVQRVLEGVQVYRRVLGTSQGDGGLDVVGDVAEAE